MLHLKELQIQVPCLSGWVFGAWGYGLEPFCSGWQHAPSTLYLRSSGLHSTTRGRCQGVVTRSSFGSIMLMIENSSKVVCGNSRSFFWLKIQQRSGVSYLLHASTNRPSYHGPGAADPACAEGFNIGSQGNSDTIWFGLGRMLWQSSKHANDFIYFFNLIYLRRGWWYVMSNVLFKTAGYASYTLELLQ